jgi:hypothetical protein
MKYLPFEKIEMRSKLSAEEIHKRILESTEPINFFRNSLFGPRSEKYFEGNVTEKNFNVRRIINYKSSFLPRIKGTFEKDFMGSRLEIKMELVKLVKYFLIAWMTFALLINLSLFSKLQSEHALLPYAPILVLLVIYSIILAAFKYESIKAKKFLLELLEAEEISK